MPRGKTPTGLIEDVQKRRESFKRRSLGLVQRAEDLSTLCAVPVAVVILDADRKGAAAPPTVMETEAGVLDRYGALPSNKRREEHRHLEYLQGLLAKEKDKLNKVRGEGPKSLAQPHKEMSRMTSAKLRGLLQEVDATLAVTEERRGALGLPGDDNAIVMVPPPPPVDSEQWTPGSSESDNAVVVVPCAEIEPWTAGSSESDNGCHYPIEQQGLGLLEDCPYPPMLQQGQGLLDDCPYSMQQQQSQGLLDDCPYPMQQQQGQGLLEDCLYPMQQQQGQDLLEDCPYPIQAYHPDGGGMSMIPQDYHHPEMNMNMLMEPAYYPQFNDDVMPDYMGGYQEQMPSDSWYYPSSMPVGTSSSFMQGPGNGNLNNGDAQGPPIWFPTESDNGYPYNMHTSGNPSAAAYPDLFTGDNFLDSMMPEFLDVDMNYMGGGSYQPQGSSNDFLHHSAGQNSSSVNNQVFFGHGRNN